MAAGGQSVAEHSPWELAGERVPALDPLVLVLQAVKPVLQALPLGIDAEDHTACRGRGGRGVSDHLVLPSRTYALSWTPPAHLALGVDRVTSTHTLHPSWDQVLPFLGWEPEQCRGRGQQHALGARNGDQKGERRSLCPAVTPTRNQGPRGLRVLPQVLTSVVPAPSQIALWPSQGSFPLWARLLFLGDKLNNI